MKNIISTLLIIGVFLTGSVMAENQQPCLDSLPEIIKTGSYVTVTTKVNNTIKGYLTGVDMNEHTISINSRTNDYYSTGTKLTLELASINSITYETKNRKLKRNNLITVTVIGTGIGMFVGSSFKTTYRIPAGYFSIQREKLSLENMVLGGIIGGLVSNLTYQLIAKQIPVKHTITCP